jgi:hypothetical protein
MSDEVDVERLESLNLCLDLDLDLNLNLILILSLCLEVERIAFLKAMRYEILVESV